MFRFTIRELVLATTIVALSVAWAIDHNYQLQRREELFLKVVYAVDKLNTTIYGPPTINGR